MLVFRYYLLARLSKGESFYARSANDLNIVLNEAAAKSLIITKQKTLYSGPIRGGDAFESAKPLEFNKKLRLEIQWSWKAQAEKQQYSR